MNGFLVSVFLVLSSVARSQVLQRGVYYMAPDLLAIHYHPSVELDFNTFTDDIAVDSCAVVSLRSVSYKNVIGFTLSSCTGTPAYLDIGNATLFTTSGSYISNETDVAITEVFDSVINETTCQSMLEGSSVQVSFNDQRWDGGEVLSIDCADTTGDVFYSGGGKFSFMVAETPLGSECSVRIRLELTTVFKRLEFDATFAGCGLEALDPTAAGVFDDTHLYLKYDYTSDDPDVSKLTLVCTVNGTSHVLPLSLYPVVLSKGIIKIPIEDPCTDADEYSLSIADGFMDTPTQRISATNGSVQVAILSNPTVTGHLCDNNVHYFPVLSGTAWRLTQVVDNGSCVLEAGFSSESIEVVINEPINCILIFEIEMTTTQIRRNTTVTIDYDCPYTQPSNGFFELPIVVLVFFFMLVALSLAIIGLEVFWVAIGKVSYIGRVVDLLPDYIERHWMGVNELTKARLRADVFMDG